MTDYVSGAESDSGYAIAVECPKCKGRHEVTVSKIGRLLYECRGALLSGTVDNWRHNISALPMKRAGDAS